MSPKGRAAEGQIRLLLSHDFWQTASGMSTELSYIVFLGRGLKSKTVVSSLAERLCVKSERKGLDGPLKRRCNSPTSRVFTRDEMKER